MEPTFEYSVYGCTSQDVFASGIDRPAADRHAGYLFQDLRLFPHMRVDRNLRYGRRPGGALSEEDVLAFLGIGHLLHRMPSTLSGGEAQRVAIGRALVRAILPLPARAQDLCRDPHCNSLGDLGDGAGRRRSRLLGVVSMHV